MAQNEVNGRALLWVGPLTVALSVVAVFAVRVAAFAVLDLDPTYPPLTYLGLAFFTVVFVTLAVLVFAVVVWKAASPIRTYRRIAIVVLVLSFIPDLFLPGQPIPGATWTAAIVLMVTHIAAWLPVQFVLTNPRFVAARAGRDVEEKI
jgi:hypothetical protein